MKKYLLFEEPLAEEMAVGFAEFGADMLFCEQHAQEFGEFMHMVKNGIQITKDDQKFMQRYVKASVNYVPKMVALLSSAPKLTAEAAQNLLHGLTSNESDSIISTINTLLMSSEEWARLKNSSASSAESSTPTPA